MDLIDEVLDNAQAMVHNKMDLFLSLCAFNYLNALVKQPEYKMRIKYGMIKPAVLRMVIELARNRKTGLCDEISVKTDDDCVYIRCYGIQFSFHHINSKMLATERPELCNPTTQWDGIRLQPIAKELYEFAKEVVHLSLEEDVIKNQIILLLQKYGKL